MKVHTSLITHVKDSNGKVHFEFPHGTILDSILDDMWPIITRYMVNKYDRYNGCLFGVGHYHGIYEKYQIVTKEMIDHQTFKEKFIETYKEINGIVALDNIPLGILCGDDNQYFIIDMENVSTFPSKKNFHHKGSKIKLHYIIDDWDEPHPICPKELHSKYNSDFDSCDSDITLFVRCDYVKEMGWVKEICDDEEISEVETSDIEIEEF